MPHDADERAFRVSQHATVFEVSAQARVFGISAREHADFSATPETFYVITGEGYVITSEGRVTYNG